jgi:hypothetical protein
MFNVDSANGFVKEGLTAVAAFGAPSLLIGHCRDIQF